MARTWIRGLTIGLALIVAAAIMIYRMTLYLPLQWAGSP